MVANVSSSFQNDNMQCERCYMTYAAIFFEWQPKWQLKKPMFLIVICWPPFPLFHRWCTSYIVFLNFKIEYCWKIRRWIAKICSPMSMLPILNCLYSTCTHIHTACIGIAAHNSTQYTRMYNQFYFILPAQILRKKNNIYSSKQHLFIKTTSIQPDSMHSSSFSFILLSKWQHSRHFEMTTCCHSCAVVQCEQCGQRIRHFSVANVWRPLCHTQNATVGHQCERNVFA